MKTRTKLLLLAGLAVLSIIFAPVFAVAGDAHATVALPPAPCASQQANEICMTPPASKSPSAPASTPPTSASGSASASATASASASASTSATASLTPTASTTTTAPSSLPVTGAGWKLLFVVGGILVVLGLLAVAGFRRGRKATFRA